MILDEVRLCRWAFVRCTTVLRGGVEAVWPAGEDGERDRPGGDEESSLEGSLELRRRAVDVRGPSLMVSTSLCS